MNDRPLYNGFGLGFAAAVGATIGALGLAISLSLKTEKTASKSSFQQSLHWLWNDYVQSISTWSRKNFPLLANIRSSQPTRWPRYYSTRGWQGKLENGNVTQTESGGTSFDDAILLGLAPDGGLFVPDFFPQIDRKTLLEWKSFTFQQLSAEIIHRYIDETIVSREEIEDIVQRSYATFRHQDVVPVVQLGKDGPIVLELFHGETFAFKDVALQFLGNLFENLLSKRSGRDAEITVLGATSGDTGSSAIYGLRGKKGVNVFILFPEGRVSPIQERQMTTVEDENIHCVSIDGFFDDAQAIVKSCFKDKEFRQKHNLAAVNSINFARILAQIVYYFYAYFRAIENVNLTTDDMPLINFSVPTGNFGDILAGYYAKLMGLPVGKLVVATNENDILDRFFKKGEYFRAPKVTPTITPSMDICVSSNFERFLYHMQGNNAIAMNEMMTNFEKTGKLLATGELLQKCQKEMISSRATKEEILEEIKNVHEKYKYILDPHSAIGIVAVRKTKLDFKSTVCLLTAHHAKFPDAVEEAIGKEELSKVEEPIELKRIMTMKTRKVILPAEEHIVKNHIDSILKV